MSIFKKLNDKFLEKKFNETISALTIKVENGDVQSMRVLGDTYFNGISGNEENANAAFPYWKMAADKGDNIAAMKVSSCLYNGDGCQVNKSEGFKYCLQAADSNEDENGNSQYYAGIFLESGNGCQKNEELSLEYYKMAALKNHSDAQFRLGRYCILKDNYHEGFFWWYCASLQGNEEAIKELNKVGEHIYEAKNKKTLENNYKKWIQEYGLTEAYKMFKTSLELRN